MGRNLFGVLLVFGFSSEMRSQSRALLVRLRDVWHSRIARWFHGKREKLWWAVGGGASLAVILVSCSTTRTLVAPPSIAGATFVGTESCETCHGDIVRDFHTATHARLKGDGEKEIGCESCHGPGSLHVESGGNIRKIVNPEKNPQTCFQCHLDVQSQFHLPQSSSRARGQDELHRLPRPAQRLRHQERRHRAGRSERDLFPMPLRAARPVRV